MTTVRVLSEEDVYRIALITSRGWRRIGPDRWVKKGTSIPVEEDPDNPNVPTVYSMEDAYWEEPEE